MNTRCKLAGYFVLLACMACVGSQEAANELGPLRQETSDTLRLALAAASWIAPHLPGDKTRALIYGAPSRGYSTSLHYLDRGEARAVAATLRSQLVDADSVRFCRPGDCPAGAFQEIVTIYTVRIVRDTGIVIVTTSTAGRPVGFPVEWHSMLTRFYRRGSEWLFDQVLEQGAS